MDRDYAEKSVETSSSATFEIIARIDRKLDSLKKALAPVTQEHPVNATDKPSGTKLFNELARLEDKLTYLLDSISL